MMRYGALLLVVLTSGLHAQPTTDSVLIRASKPYAALVSAIEGRGGRVTHQFRYIDAIAAQIPRDALPAISAITSPGAISKDLLVAAPVPIEAVAGRARLNRTGDEQRIEAGSAQPLAALDLAALATLHPNAYLLNNAINRASVLHAAGITGAGVLVAVVDSGIRPGFPHITLDGSVVGCEDFVNDGLGCSNSGNNPHGTFVAGMISANVVFTFSATNAFRDAVLAECPACFSNPPANTMIPMIGTAPLSSIYAFRVFGPSGGAPTSVIMTAVERVIELREKYDAGDSSGRNIQVCNMSLGGSTLFAGRDLFDSLVDVVLAKGIVPVIAAGNAGPASLTVGSPGTSLGAVTVGAASLAHNERILERLQYGPVLGSLYRPFLGTQTAYFSSRGPNADGRIDPDVTSNGFANFGQGYASSPLGISIGSGTSFSTPSVAGIAALLRQAVPGATARQIRNAIIASANPALLADGSTELDRGAGYVDAAAARALLASGNVPDIAPAPAKTVSNVKVNVEQGSFLNVRDGLVRETFAGLKPSQRYDILYQVNPNTSQVIVTLSGVTPSLPPAQQNQLFGDDILLAIHSAKTSSIGEGDYPEFVFTTGGSFAINRPETGIMRITVNGDWTNAGRISGQVSVFSVTDPIPGFSSEGKITQGQAVVIPVNVPAGTATAEFRLGWRADWGSYPTNDIDLILVLPDGKLNLAGATVNNPEAVTVHNPLSGQWLAVIQGFDVSTGGDKYEFRATLDGKIVR